MAEPERVQALIALLASINEWLGNDKGLMNEDVIEWRDQLEAALAGSVPAQHDRMKELAKAQAFYRHSTAVARMFVEDGVDTGHDFDLERFTFPRDILWSFDVCSHPDCVLARSTSGGLLSAGRQELFRRHAEDLPPRMLVYKASDVDALLASPLRSGEAEQGWHPPNVEQLREWFKIADAMVYPANQEAMREIIAWAREQAALPLTESETPT